MAEAAAGERHPRGRARPGAFQPTVEFRDSDPGAAKSSMDTLNVDVAVIGAGTAGQNARREIEKRGGTPLMIERGPHGTTCARVGCMPSKLLVAAADVAHMLSRRRSSV